MDAWCCSRSGAVLPSRHPYEGAPAYRRWRSAVGDVAADALDPVVAMGLKIAPQDKVVTAGSCFAQHIARHLRSNGFGFLVTETAHPILPPAVAEAFQYGVYSARYGNIYTTRQLRQLHQRAYGRFAPEEDVWIDGQRLRDPFRPTIQPNGFATLGEFHADRRQHFAAVRQAFETMDVFIFTLGLTEAWASRGDGAVFPLCPGVSGGVYDPARHQFVNLSVDQVVADFTAFLADVRALNPKVKVILTVSPVPLAATALDRHVMVSTAYSKAVLRVAAEMLTALDGVHYFPSYEGVTGPGVGDYFAEDRRTVTEAGVERVMSLFFRHATGGAGPGAAVAAPAVPEPEDFLTQTRAVVQALCDESLLDRD